MDRPGVLSDITQALAELSLNIASAHITTFGEKVVDTFYVCDLVGHKITSATRQARIAEYLKDVLQSGQVKTNTSGIPRYRTNTTEETV